MIPSRWITSHLMINKARIELRRHIKFGFMNNIQYVHKTEYSFLKDSLIWQIQTLISWPFSLCFFCLFFGFMVINKTSGSSNPFASQVGIIFYSCPCASSWHRGMGTAACDPGLEETAHNDDSAHENTEKCWEGKKEGEQEKERTRRNAQVCFVVGTETEAIFVGMKVGVRGGWLGVVGTDVFRGMGWCTVIVDICPELWLSGLGRGGSRQSERLCSISASGICGKTLATVWTLH